MTNHPPSMLYDVRRQLPTEVDFLSGAIAREAEQVGRAGAAACGGVPVDSRQGSGVDVSSDENAGRPPASRKVPSEMPGRLTSRKLDRVRALMKDQDMSALVVRAPDNIVYLTNYWCMKGYDAVVFPREGEPTLIALEPQQADAERNSWTRDIRLFKGYDAARSAAAAVSRARPRA